MAVAFSELETQEWSCHKGHEQDACTLRLSGLMSHQRAWVPPVATEVGVTWVEPSPVILSLSSLVIRAQSVTMIGTVGAKIHSPSYGHVSVQL